MVFSFEVERPWDDWKLHAGLSTSPRVLAAICPLEAYSVYVVIFQHRLRVWVGCYQRR